MSMLRGPTPIYPKAAARLHRTVTNLWQRITEPSVFILKPERRRRARLLSAILLVMLGLGLAAAAVNPWVAQQSPAFAQMGNGAVAMELLSVLLLIMAYGLSRSRYDTVASGLTVVIVFATILAALFILPPNSVALHFLILPLLVGSLFLYPRGILIAWIISMGELLALGALVPRINQRDAVSTLYLIVVAGALVWVVARVRQRDLEQIHAQSAELRASERHFRALIENSTDVIALLDAEGTIVYTGPSTAHLFGYLEEEFVGRSAFEFIHPDDLEYTLGKLAEVLQEPRASASAEYRVRHKDGTWRWAEAAATNLLEEPNVKAIVVNLRDVTARKRANEALQASEARLNNILASAAEAIVAIDQDERILLFNKAAEEIFGYRAEEMIGQSLDLLLPLGFRKMHDAQVESFATSSETTRAIAMRQPVRGRRKDGTEFFAEVGISKLVEDGRVISTAILNDITQRKWAEAEIQQRAQEFAALYETARAVASHQDLASLFQTVVEQARKLLSPKTVVLTLYDAIRGDLEVVAQHASPLPPGTRIRLGQGVSGYTAKIREPVIVNNYSEWEDRIERLPGVPLAPKIGVPLLHKGELIGTLLVAEEVYGRQFSEGDAQLLSLLASPAASAVHNARLFEETSVRAEQLALLYDAGLTLNSVLEPRAQLQFLFEIAAKAMHAQHVEFWRVDTTRNLALYELGTGYTAEVMERLQALGLPLEEERGMVPWVVHHRMPLHLPDVLADPRWIASDPEIRSALWVPVLHDNQVLGVLAVLSSRRHQFTGDDARLLTLFANQAAIALENARLFGELQDALSVTTRLYQLSGQILGTNTLEETAGLVCRIVRDGFGADATSIQLLSTDRQIEFQHHLGFSAALDPDIRPRPDGLTAQTLARGEPVIFSDPEVLHPAMRAEGIQAVIALPLRRETNTLGVLFVDYREPHGFTDREVELLTLFANQAALALDRVRLLAETRQRMAELEAVNVVSGELRAAQTLDEMLPQLLDSTLAVLHASTGSIWLYDPVKNELRMALSRGWDGQEGVPPTPPEKPGEGIAGYVFATGQPYVASDLHIDLRLSETVGQRIPPGRGGAVIPIRAADKVIGTLILNVVLPRQVLPSEIRLLTTISDIAGNAIQRTRLYEQTEHRLEHLRALRQIDQAISGSLNLGLTLEVVLQQVMEQLQADAADILLFDPHTLQLTWAAGLGFRTSALQHAPLRLGEGLAGRAGLERQMVSVPDLTQEPGGLPHFLSLESFKAYHGVPVLAKGQIKGILEVYHRTPLYPDPEWLDFLEALAGQAAIAIDNTELFEGLARSNLELAIAYDTTLEGWTRALDLRDKETEGHSERVTEMTVRLARAMGLREEELAHIRRGALLHDIGKVGIPDRILFKPGPLTDEEWKIMRLHPVYARELLSPIVYLRRALDIPYCHHEKWDGTGYPQGLKGEQIPLAARIFAVVDVWDALRSDRPYRGAWDDEQVGAYIRQQSGTHFDPKVVQVFLEELASTTLDALPPAFQVPSPSRASK